MKRFTRSNLSHPTYRALAELGKVIPTIFWCKYLHSESLRREVNEALNVVENWNNAKTPLIWSHVNPYGTFRLNLDERLPIQMAA